MDCKEIQPVHPKGNQSWIFIGRTDAEAETPILWPPDTKNWLIGKDPDAGKDWRQEEMGTTEDEIDGWMASPPQWTWVWVNSGSWWWTARPGVLQSMGSQRVRHNWASELNWNSSGQSKVNYLREITHKCKKQRKHLNGKDSEPPKEKPNHVGLNEGGLRELISMLTKEWMGSFGRG